MAAQIARQTYRKLYMVVGFVEDKDLSRVRRCFPGRRTTSSRRPGSAARSTSASSRAGPPVTVAGRVRPDRERGARVARELAGPDDMIFIGGSTYVVAEVL